MWKPWLVLLSLFSISLVAAELGITAESGSRAERETDAALHTL